MENETLIVTYDTRDIDTLEKVSEQQEAAAKKAHDDTLVLETKAGVTELQLHLKKSIDAYRAFQALSDKDKLNLDIVDDALDVKFKGHCVHMDTREDGSVVCTHYREGFMWGVEYAVVLPPKEGAEFKEYERIRNVYSQVVELPTPNGEVAPYYIISASPLDAYYGDSPLYIYSEGDLPQLEKELEEPRGLMPATLFFYGRTVTDPRIGTWRMDFADDNPKHITYDTPIYLTHHNEDDVHQVEWVEATIRDIIPLGLGETVSVRFSVPGRTRSRRRR